jgi:hypothetical protein
MHAGMNGKHAFGKTGTRFSEPAEHSNYVYPVSQLTAIRFFYSLFETDTAISRKKVISLEFSLRFAS